MAEILIHPTLAERLDDALQLAADSGGVLVVKGRGTILTLVQFPPDMAARRLRGMVVGFEASYAPTWTDAWRKCYGDENKGIAACIRINLAEVSNARFTGSDAAGGRSGASDS